MKKLLLIILFIAVLFGCNKKNSIDVLPNYEVEYYKVSNYERYTLGLVPEETQKKMQEDVFKIFNNLKDRGEIKNPYFYELYINNGRIEKLKAEKKWDSTIDDKLLEKMSDWKFGKYVNDGISQKYRMRFSFGAFHYKTKDIDTVNVVVYGNQAVEIDKKIFFIVAEEMPSPIGGLKAIQQEVKYPKEAKVNGIEGRVFIKAYIDTSGTVVKTEIIRGIGSGCDESAAYAVEKVKFTPAYYDGEKTNVQVTVPILFKLQ
ncbi:MAG: energy transducer TonB [Bacteroidota bacterium]